MLDGYVGVISTSLCNEIKHMCLSIHHYFVLYNLPAQFGGSDQTATFSSVTVHC